VEQGIEIYHKMEKEMRETMSEYGGSISHHHGIGQIKSDELHEVTDDTQMRLQKAVKHLFDGESRFCENNYLAQ
jgi:FAD/FMN-containing dehydrogenase